MSENLKTKLYDLHAELSAKFVPFAGYEMPVQYELGVMKEHLHTRAQAGLFDVSHMGQVLLHGDVSEKLETLIPQVVLGLGEGRQRYGFFTNEQGGIEDDLMFANRGDHIYMVVNAACKDADIAHLKAHLGDQVEVVEDRSLVAIQGPEAENVLAKIAPDVREMRFMDVRNVEIMGATCWVSRSGYTGEDGFEISIPDENVEAIARALLEDARLEPIGLGARDSLRIEAGLCLFDNDIDVQTSPIEAGLTWAIQKRRRENGGFKGAARIQSELADGVSRLRVGLRPQGRAPMRAGVALFESETSTASIGQITSGGFGPSLEAPVAMGYVQSDFAKTGTEIWGELRGKRQRVTVSDLPFTPLNFKR
jgi:aminomethyltransferase